ncbi:MAG: DUF6874 family protein [bacterium]
MQKLTDEKRIEAAIDTLSSFMWECDLPYHHGMSPATWEPWAEERVKDFHLRVGLDLDLLETCDMGTLGHDLNGICSYWDMESHSMRDCFLPRCTK